MERWKEEWGLLKDDCRLKDCKLQDCKITEPIVEIPLCGKRLVDWVIERLPITDLPASGQVEQIRKLIR